MSGALQVLVLVPEDQVRVNALQAADPGTLPCSLISAQPWEEGVLPESLTW